MNVMCCKKSCLAPYLIIILNIFEWIAMAKEETISISVFPQRKPGALSKKM